jgi:hypothetical protein
MAELCRTVKLSIGWQPPSVGCKGRSGNRGVSRPLVVAQQKDIRTMRKILLATVAVVPLAALAGLALPALAESGDGSAEASCVTQPGDATSGSIDLSQIPVKPVTGPLAVQGVGDGCDDGLAGGHDHGVRAGSNLEREGLNEVEARD